MKAYVVSDDEESVVVFDEISVSARRRGGNIIGCEFEGVESCVRAPEFDQYAPGPVPASALLDAGWWVSDGEGDRVTADDEPWIDRSGEAWRSPWRWLADREQAALVRRHERETVDAVMAMFPFATDVYPWRFERGKWRANFSFPGGNGLAKWNVGDESVWVDAGDVDAWHAVQLRGDK